MNTNAKTLVLLALVAGVAIRLVPFSLPSFTDPDHYYHLRISEAIVSQNSFPQYDPLSYQGRPHTYYPMFHVMSSSTALLTGLPAFYAYAGISVLVALAGLLAVFVLAKKIFGEDAAVYSLIFAAVLPASLIRSAGMSRPDSLSLLLLPLLAIALLEDRRWLVALLAFFLPLLHPLTALFVSALVIAEIAAGLSLGQNRLKHALWFFIPLLAASAYYLRFPLGRLSAATTFLTSSEMQAFNLDFAMAALGVAWLFILFAVLRQEKTVAPRFLWLWLFGSSALMLLASRNAVFAAAPASVLAAAGLRHALAKNVLRPAVFLLFALGLSFSAILFLADLGPQYSKQTVSAARWLGENNAVVSYWDKGHLLTYYGLPVFMDGYFEFAPQLDERQSLSMRFFRLPSEHYSAQLREKGVGFVFVDEKMRKDVPFFGGFAESSPEISRVFDSGGAQIYSLS